MRQAILTAIIGALFVLCWSSGYIGGVLATDATMPALSLFSWRFLVAAGVLAILTLFCTRVAMARTDLMKEMIVGLFTMGGFLLASMLALQQGVSAGITALIASLQPALAAAMAGRWLGDRLSAAGWVGMVIAGAGVALCVAGEVSQPGAAPLWAYGLPLVSVLSVTVGSVLTVRWSTPLPLPATLTSQLLAASMVFSVAASVLDPGGLAAPQFTQTDLVVMAWLILFSSFGGFGFFVVSLHRMGVTRTSTLVYLTPPVTLVWSMVLFGEQPGGAEVAGMAMAALGVAVILVGHRLRRLLPPRAVRNAAGSAASGAPRREAGYNPGIS